MAEEFKARLLDAWPDPVIEGVQRESQGALIDGERSVSRRLIPVHDIASIVSSLCAVVTLGRTIWSQRKGAAKAETPTNPEKLNQQVRLSGNFGAEVTSAEVKSTEPLKLEVAIRNPPQTETRQFVIEITRDGAEIKQKT